ncbi:MAG: hypothetical protein IPM55_22935 [Acidobacteria bacterium]|nr:hypothetical protein [Acidobacteriota bacterium]
MRKRWASPTFPEDEHARGLLLDFDLADNSILGTHYRAPAAPSIGLIDYAAVHPLKADRLIRDFDIRPRYTTRQSTFQRKSAKKRSIIAREFDLLT